MNIIHVNTNFLNEPIGMKFPHFLQYDPESLGNAVDEDFSSVPRHPDNVILRFVYGVRGNVEFHYFPVYRRTPDLAHTPALPGGDLPLN